MSTPAFTGPPSPTPNATAFVTRTGTQLYLSGEPYRIAGPNIYWLGLDENDPPGSITYPSRERVLEVLATAYVMGANTVRATTLGVSVGCELCVMPSRGSVNQEALEVIDFAVWAAKLYGLRLIIPLTDQYEYYHGGIFSFLEFESLSTSDYSPFYDITSPVFADFQFYVGTLLNHTNIYTNIPLHLDPTILAWESGNELGGYGGRNLAPPTWTAAMATFIRSLGAQSLFIDGSYGINKASLSIPEVDIYSNHFYPPHNRRLSSDASLTSSAGKAYIAGEFDWVSKGSDPRMWALVAIPALLALAVLPLPKRWFPWRIRCGCLRRKRLPIGSDDGLEPRPRSARPPLRKAHSETQYRLFEASQSSTLNISDPSDPDDTAVESLDAQQPAKRRDGIAIRKWHLSLAIFLLLTPAAAVALYFLLPNTLASFVAAVSADDRVSGALFWSLFGRNDNCTAYIQHNDGYTLHYPGDDAYMLKAVQVLVDWGREMTGVGAATWSQTLPAVGCPQQVDLSQLPNSTSF